MIIINKEEYILAVDPGDTTGYAFAKVSQEKVEMVVFGEAHYPHGIRALIKKVQESKKVKTVVIEDFIIRQPLMGERPSALRIIGGFELAEGLTIVLQQPFEKRRCPDSLLAKLNLTNRSKHVQDAFRHAVIYAQKHFNFRA